MGYVSIFRRLSNAAIGRKGRFRIGTDYRIAKGSSSEYETRIKAGEFVVITQGSRGASAESPKAVLAATKHQGIKEHLLLPRLCGDARRRRR